MMRRRDFLKGVAAGTTAMGFGALKGSAAAARPREPFLLSSNGCGRATGYAETNKIVTVGGKTHVVWLDSVKEGFRVRVRTLDRATGTWSSTYTVGEAYDNHGGPALTVDSKGHLHIVYYPHHHPFRYRRSSHPNDASAWDSETKFGTRCTYPTLVVGPDDTLYLTCRESDKGNHPWVVNLYTKKPNGGWQGPTTILRADVGGYAHFQEALAWGPDHRTLHLSTRMYGGKPGRAHTLGYMRSLDSGKCWERTDGKRIELPATSSTISVIAQDRPDGKRAHRCGSIAVDAAGRPHVLFSETSLPKPEAWIATPGKSGQWRRHPLLRYISKDLPGWCGAMPGGITFGADDRIFVALTATELKVLDGEKCGGWGSPRNEVVWLESSDGGRSFSAKMVSKPNPSCAHWLPNVERPTGHNRVDVPGVIYTAGTRGENNKQIVSNGVWWVG